MKRIDEKIDKYLNERDDDLRDALSRLDKDVFKELRERYFGLSDNISGFVSALEVVSEEDLYFKKELRIAKQIEKMFKKMTLGRAI